MFQKKGLLITDLKNKKVINLIILFGAIIAFALKSVYVFYALNNGRSFLSKELAIILLVFFLLFLIFYTNFLFIKRAKAYNNVKKVIFITLNVFLTGIFMLTLYFFGYSFLYKFKLADFNQIHNIHTYLFYNYDKVPDNISETMINSEHLVNQRTGKEIEYEKILDESFKICTDFLLSNKKRSYQSDYRYIYKHKSGYDCVEVNLKKDYIDLKYLTAYYQ